METLKEIESIVENLLDGVMDDISTWWETGENFIPISSRRFIESLKELGYTIVRED